jgi:hypothetical protein
MLKILPVFLLLYSCTGAYSQNGKHKIKNITCCSYTSTANLPIIDGYPVAALVPKTNFSDALLLAGLKGITLLEARPERNIVGFTPIDELSTETGYPLVGLQITGTPVEWLQESFNRKNIIPDTTSERQLVVVLQKFWFSHSASERYTSKNPKLLTTLYYHFDIYTSNGALYYPQSTFSGSVADLFDNGNAYNVLTDSLLALLKKKILSVEYNVKETASNQVLAADFNNYIAGSGKKILHPEEIPIGVYATYNDFLAKAPVSDTVAIDVKYNNRDMSDLYACQLTAFRNGEPHSCYKYWGYFDGSSLFVNAGNGIYVKLVYTNDDFVFFYLRKLFDGDIKPHLLNSMQIGNSSYDILERYARAFNLTYQLDYDTGKLH